MKRYIIPVVIALAGAFGVQAQFALKSNLLYDATTTPNIGAELGIADRQTVNLVYGFNPWSFSRHGEKSMVKHWVIQPEWRWWLCTRFSGHFIGVHAMAGEFNAANASLPVPGFFFSGDNLRKLVRDERAQGTFAGVGATYGYQYALSRHWNLEAEIGIGYNHVWYDHYACGECGGKLGSGNTNYFGVTKLGLSIMYLF